ncbi:unnamed protein product [Ilex paraguariensis]|uniref:Uncharacterized protein n=1 Tax=Ilex paraguariensis TaxID=185542 RepID=A0ABC8RNI3_9AQUA
MEKPATPNQSQISSASEERNGNTQKRKKLPNARELIAHYESQGMETQEASVKVIEDLQNVLFRVVTSNRGGKNNGGNGNKKGNSMAEISRKLDVINVRLVNLEMKVDSKPGYPESLAIGVASGAVLRGIGGVLPHVAGAFGQIWNAVRSATKINPSSSS